MASVLALALANLTGRWFSARAFVALAPGSPNSLWGGPVAYVLGIFGSVVYGAPFALTLVTLAEPLFGASPGKQLLRLRIASRDGTPARRSRLFLRWTVQYVGTWGLVASFAFGSGGGASAAALAGLVVLAGALWVCAPGGLTLHDRISHTLVLS